MTRYIDADTEREIREAIRQGITIDAIAGRLGITADELSRLLGLPAWRPEPQASDDCDLWRADELADRL